MERIINTYVERKGLLGQALEICEGSSRLNEFTNQCISAKMGRMIELGSIYIKGNVTSGKIPTRIPTKSSTVGFASLRRTWGT